MTKRHDRFLEQSTNVVIVILAQFVNFILLIGGLTSLWGLYSVLLFCFLIYLYDLLRYALTHYGGNALSDCRPKCSGGGEAAAHVHGPPTYNEIRIFVAVWLIWWAVTQFFYEAGLQLSLSWILLPFLFLCVLAVSIVPQSVACDVFPLLAIATLALPSADWMPQYMAWTRDALRVFAYFVAVFVADFFVERNVLSEQSVIDAAQPAILTRRKQNDHDDTSSASTSEHAFSQTTIYFCVIVDRYETVWLAEQRRIKAIIALSAWVLIVPKLMILLFTLGLLVVHGLLFLQQRRLANKPTQPPQPQVALQIPPQHHDIEAPPLKQTIADDDDDDDDASASASEDQSAPPPPPIKKQQSLPPPTATRALVTSGGGVRTKIISINRTQ